MPTTPYMQSYVVRPCSSRVEQIPIDKVNQPFQRSLRFRFGDRVGLIPRLLFCSLLAILSTTAHVQVMTLRSVRENGRICSTRLEHGRTT